MVLSGLSGLPEDAYRWRAQIPGQMESIQIPGEMESTNPSTGLQWSTDGESTIPVQMERVQSLDSLQWSKQRCPESADDEQLQGE